MDTNAIGPRVHGHWLSTFPKTLPNMLLYQWKVCSSEEQCAMCVPFYTVMTTHYIICNLQIVDIYQNIRPPKNNLPFLMLPQLELWRTGVSWWGSWWFLWTTKLIFSTTVRQLFVEIFQTLQQKCNFVVFTVLIAL